ncbi:calcium-binding and coiled-coil domain-containing protein 2 isoform X2 [Genypterus blacodes]|uniref:calcium-binding and coiled-coil domain-containing protein 2 isoform X2 n=1 Tax=Genypterus blacodes TaxID=154954 RepID=UPI003F75F94A
MDPLDLMDSMESPIESFSQVIFSEVPYSYPPATPVTCCYTLTAAFQPNTRDWVGIFKVGWSRAKDYHTFLWVEPCQDVIGEQPVTKHVVFNEYYLPKDDVDFYQFCYIDSNGQVRGASTPFCFKHPVEQNAESSPEDDLLVITTQKVEQSMREKTELTKELDQKMEENRNLQSSLETQQEELNSLKRQKKQKELENSELLKEMGEIKEQNESLRCALKEKQQETDSLKEILAQTANQQTAVKQSEGSLGEAFKQKEEEKYSQAVVKITHLKQEREKLRGKIDIQGTEIAALKQKKEKAEQELLQLRDRIQLLEVDLQSSKRDKERLSVKLETAKSLPHDKEELKRENQVLHRRLSEQDSLRKAPDDSLNMQCQTLRNQLQDARALLAKEVEESKTNKWRADQMEREMQQCKDQLERFSRTIEELAQKSSKQELLLKEAHGFIAEKEGIIKERDDVIMEKESMDLIEKQEKGDLATENLNLRKDVEWLQRELAKATAAPAEAELLLPDSPPGSAAWQQLTHADSQQQQHLYQSIGDTSPREEEGELSLVCRHCQEIFPGITLAELEQHEQNHKVCPLCALNCDKFEQEVYEDHVNCHLDAFQNLGT